MRVVISGAGGNLGTKLRMWLEASAWCTAIDAIDVKPAPSGLAAKTSWIVADLRDAADGRWITPARAADGIVHLAAQSPAPNSSWTEGAQSFDMTANLLEVAGGHRCRFLFASSNHAMGGYKDAPLPPGESIGPDTPPLPGTRTFDGVGYSTSTAYGSMKLFCERAVIARARGSDGRLTAVNLRIGWCQRGDNLASTLSAKGGGRAGTQPQDPEEERRDLLWFRNMWLSNRDYQQLCERALRAPADAWPEPALTVAGVSGNAGTPWDLETGHRYLGYTPEDDVWAALSAS